jgi:hypothetical protein
MSLSPEEAPNIMSPVPGDAPPVVRAASWQSRLLGFCFAIFTFEIGLFLVVFPWMDDTWNLNYFQSFLPILKTLWNDPYFRGGVTGLGFVNIYIACAEIGRLLRRA